jgi:hypothetical protein
MKYTKEDEWQMFVSEVGRYGMIVKVGPKFVTVRWFPSNYFHNDRYTAGFQTARHQNNKKDLPWTLLEDIR